MIRRPPRSTRTDTLFPYTTLFRSAIEAFGGIDILVNNLGQYEPFAPVWTDATPEQWAATYESNVIAAVRTIRASIEGMKQAGWGRIINIASGAYTEPPPELDRTSVV